jgi:hypothetical protein
MYSNLRPVFFFAGFAPLSFFAEAGGFLAIMPS